MTKMINLSMKFKQKVASCGSWMQKIAGVFAWERLKGPHFTNKCGVFGWQQRLSAKIWGHWVTAVLKIGVFGVLHPRHLHNGRSPTEQRLHRKWVTRFLTEQCLIWSWWTIPAWSWWLWLHYTEVSHQKTITLCCTSYVSYLPVVSVRDWTII